MNLQVRRTNREVRGQARTACKAIVYACCPLCRNASWHPPCVREIEWFEILKRFRPDFFSRNRLRAGSERHAPRLVQQPAVAPLEHGGPERAALARAAVEIDAVAEMGGVRKRCVAVDHQPRVRLCMVEKA